jgi:hypothetical protein
VGAVGEVAVKRALFLLLLAAAPSKELPIPDRKQHASSPPSGWCGETAIQEALLYSGVWASQKQIHAAGKSKHPDLYSDEIPIALTELGVKFTKHAGKTSYEQFVRDAIDAGDPVLAGVKILPSEHPTWGLDHFVLVVGYGPSGFLTNTTWDKQQWISATAAKGISFKGAFYGLRIRGSGPRLRVMEETDKKVKLSVDCPKPRIAVIDVEPVARFSCP